MVAKKTDKKKDEGQDSVHPFIDATTAMQAYEESKKWLRPYFEPIDEYERIARGKPSTNIPKNLPRVTDGTVSSIITDNPKQVIQQEPTGINKCHEYPEYAQVADYKLTHTLIPMANRQGTELQKDWIMTSKALTWGRSTSYSFFTTTNGIMHVDFVIPYVKDILTEKGKVYVPDSNIRMMRSWYQKRDIKAIINREKWLEQNIPGYKTDWNLKMLADFIEGGASAKPSEVMTPAEREKGGDTGGFEVIHAFQVGKNAEFYSFSPQYKDGETFRTKMNTDPRGLMPFDDMYYEIDLSNPNGRGIPETQGGKQNLIDQQMQMFQYVSTMMQAPPAITFGNVNKATMKMKPNAIWDGGNGNNRVEFLKIDNTQIANFANNYGLLKSQILQGASSNQAATISSEAGNPSFSKTQAGVQAQQSQMNISANYLRKQFEEWKGKQWETAINIYFSEMKGKEEIRLDAEDLKDFQSGPAKKFLKEDKLVIPFKEIEKVAFKFEVDPSSSEVKEDSENADKLKEVYALVSQDPDPEIQKKKTRLLKILIDEIGAEGTDDLFPELDEGGTDENGQPINGQEQQPQMTPEMVQQMVMQTVQQMMEQSDMDDKKAQRELKSRELDLKEQQFHADTTLKADKQAHDQEMAETKHHDENEKAIVSTLQGLELPEEGENGQVEGPPVQQEAGEPLDGQLSPDEEQLVHFILMNGGDENACEQAVLMARQGVPIDEIIQAVLPRGANV